MFAILVVTWPFALLLIAMRRPKTTKSVAEPVHHRALDPLRFAHDRTRKDPSYIHAEASAGAEAIIRGVKSGHR